MQAARLLIGSTVTHPLAQRAVSFRRACVSLVRWRVDASSTQRHASRVSVPRFNELPPLLTLHELPPAFTDLYALGGKGQCARCGSAPVDPAICLLCGKMLCLSRCPLHHGTLPQQGPSVVVRAHHERHGVCRCRALKSGSAQAHAANMLGACVLAYLRACGCCCRWHVHHAHPRRPPGLRTRRGGPHRQYSAHILRARHQAAAAVH